MVEKVNPNRETPKLNPEGELLPRELESMALSTQIVGEDVINDSIPNWQAALQTKSSFEKEVSKPKSKTTGKTDLVASKDIFHNRAYMTRVAPRLKGTAPFNAG